MTYRIKTARKKSYIFESKFETIRQELLTMRAKMREGAPHWKKTDDINARYIRFRLSKNENLVGVQPIRHWTDSKIRCHLFTCVVAIWQINSVFNA